MVVGCKFLLLACSFFLLFFYLLFFNLAREGQPHPWPSNTRTGERAHDRQSTSKWRSGRMVAALRPFQTFIFQFLVINWRLFSSLFWLSKVDRTHYSCLSCNRDGSLIRIARCQVMDVVYRCVVKTSIVKGGRFLFIFIQT